MTYPGTVVTFLGLLAVTWSPSTAAQEPGAGDRVRVDGRTVGVLVDLTASAVVVDRGADTVAFRRANLSKLEVSEGTHRHTGRGAFIGGVAGGVALGVTGFVACASTSGGFIDCSSVAPVAALIGGVVGMAGGAILGAVVGTFFTGENWRPVALGRTPIALTTTTHGMAVVGRIRF